jgi:hypothetical protein
MSNTDNIQQNISSVIEKVKREVQKAVNENSAVRLEFTIDVNAIHKNLEGAKKVGICAIPVTDD